MGEGYGDTEDKALERAVDDMRQRIDAVLRAVGQFGVKESNPR